MLIEERSNTININILHKKALLCRYSRNMAWWSQKSLLGNLGVQIDLSIAIHGPIGLELVAINLVIGDRHVILPLASETLRIQNDHPPVGVDVHVTTALKGSKHLFFVQQDIGIRVKLLVHHLSVNLMGIVE